ncbi:protein-glutamate methylesterase/protein-glutamine glutaminase [Clostridium taeniosporum]|uniref:Protein-glutamate methylesterase/protein-glutamine glutaminase n=1 Tax=Clostridium taeniosporum TaxID=394958 RepID=A0A1D7XNI7_9CLOT|nr:chemotaxis response regulator protein-glutamate methylesterase [Clostridium taeniosporum]AOR24901.1 chemotaxis response regulator protein-glutamate methylesterase [Clostridium taeniosporum]
MSKIKVIVVDDSAFMRKMISEMLEEGNEIEVIAKFRNGKELIEKVDNFNPDIITLDLEMPQMDGLETLKELHKKNKNYSIIMLSSLTTKGSEKTMECLENGAIDFITKPSGSISLDIRKVQENLIEKIKIISKRGTRSRINNKSSEISKVTLKNTNLHNHAKMKELNRSEHKNIAIIKNKKIDAIVIGASTGGPKALQQLLTKFQSNIGVPIFVVQHMPSGFTKAFAERLNRICNLRVLEAEEGLKIENNVIYIAKGGYHMTVGTDGKIHLNEEDPIWGVRPAVDKLFDSAIKAYRGNLISVVLTGMGRDGAKGTSNVKDYGGITISEDESTCTIYGMPKATFETGKVDLVLPLYNICDEITKILKKH